MPHSQVLMTFQGDLYLGECHEAYFEVFPSEREHPLTDSDIKRYLMNWVEDQDSLGITYPREKLRKPPIRLAVKCSITEVPHVLVNFDTGEIYNLPVGGNYRLTSKKAIGFNVSDVDPFEMMRLAEKIIDQQTDK